MKNRTLINLAVGEVAASVSFLFAFVMLQKVLDLGMVSIITLSFLISLLLQGSFYWMVRYRSLKNNKTVPFRMVSLFSFLRILNLLILLGIPVVVFSLFENYMDLFFAIGIYLFSLIEYINYYWYRLSYGKSGFNIFKLMRTGFRKSSLNKLISKRGNR